MVLQIQRMSTEDGPGLRSTAFLKGCPLACAWCHNPEGISFEPELQWIGSRCIGCGACVAACAVGALSRSASGELLLDRSRCRLGGTRGNRARDVGSKHPRSAGTAPCADGPLCAEACPTLAMERLGTPMTAEALAMELLKDKAYFARSDRGGITLSGGEVTAQPGFSGEVLRLIKEAGMHTALDTCGLVAWNNLADLYRHVDLVLYDLKVFDGEAHRRLTGAPNAAILDNLRKTASLMTRAPLPASLWIRTPIIPGATDGEENIAAIGRFLAQLSPPRLERWELCAFNDLCADKYRRLGREWAYAGQNLMKAADMARLRDVAEEALGKPGIVTWSGPTRLEQQRSERHG
jgi:pyruvate formate lyase activating enzyme